MLSFHRTALRLRRELADLHTEDLVWQPSPARVLVFDRGARLRCVVNLGDEPVRLLGTAVLTSIPLEDSALPSDAAAWVERQD